MSISFVGYSPDITFRRSIVNLLSFNYINPAFTFARNASATYTGPDAATLTAAANAPRWEWQDNRPSGLLINPGPPADEVFTTSLDAIRFNPVRGTFIARWSSLTANDGFVLRAFNDSADSLDLRRLDASTIRFRKITPSGGTTNLDVPLPYVSGAFVTAAVSYSETGAAISINGGAPVESSVPGVPVVSSVRLGSGSPTANVMNGRIQYVSYIPNSITGNELRYLSSIT
jgi:hypothetical protein